MIARRRTGPPLIAVVGALLLYLLLGHAQHPGETMEEAATGAGICIMLVTIVAVVAAGRPPRRGMVWPPVASASPVLVQPATAPLPRARPSPQWLQRFLN